MTAVKLANAGRVIGRSVLQIEAVRLAVDTVFTAAAGKVDAIRLDVDPVQGPQGTEHEMVLTITTAGSAIAAGVANVVYQVEVEQVDSAGVPQRTILLPRFGTNNPDAGVTLVSNASERIEFLLATNPLDANGLKQPDQVGIILTIQPATIDFQVRPSLAFEGLRLEALELGSTQFTSLPTPDTTRGPVVGP